jgi:hypothetical protein
MNLIRNTLLILCCSFPTHANTATYTEPSTKISFDHTIKLNENELQLTGADRRKEWGKEVYAIAHYSQAPLDKNLSAEENINLIIDSDSPKAIILKGGETKIPARGIRWAWNKGLKDVGYTNQENKKTFVKAFKKSFSKGDEIIFDATTNESFKVFLNTKLIGEWTDPLLQRAIWEICLNEKSDLVERKNLVVRDFKPVVKHNTH